MFVYLNDVVNAINCNVNTFFDPISNEFYYESEVAGRKEELIQLPLVNTTDMLNSFVKYVNNRTFTNYCRNNSLDIVFFYKAIDRFHLEDDWEQYRYNYLSAIAEDWCNQNNIPFTRKQKYGDKEIDIPNLVKSYIHSFKKPL